MISSWRKGGGRLAGAVAASLILTAAACGDQAKQVSSADPSSGMFMDGTAAPPSTLAGDYMAGRFAENHHDFDSASRYFTHALSIDPDGTELMQRSVLVLGAQGRVAAAAAIAQRLLSYDDDAAVGAVIIAVSHAKTGDWAGVERSFSVPPRNGLNKVVSPLVLAWARMGEKQPDAALEALAPLKEDSRDRPLYQLHAALINDQAGRPQAANQAFDDLIANGGANVLRAAQLAADFYNRNGETAKASGLMDAYIKAHPGVARFEIDPGSRPVSDATAGLAEALFGVAGSLSQGGAGDLALVFARLGLDLKPDFPLDQILVADILQSNGRLADANEVYRSIDPRAGLYWSAQLRVAANLDAMDQVDEAIRTLDALASQRPDRPDALVGLGDLLRHHQRWNDAAVAYGRAIAAIGPLKREDWTVFYARGIALDEAKQWDRAEADFKKALELDPNQPEVLNYLGYSWIERNQNIEQARGMIEKAAAERPTNGFIVDSLGWVFYRSGQYSKAVEVLERAVELEPEDAAINDHLGDALWAVGRFDEARFQWQRALVFRPEAELKATIEKKIKDGLPVQRGSGQASSAQIVGAHVAGAPAE
jgi:tetratricopeptide (TPR) repeat protein